MKVAGVDFGNHYCVCAVAAGETVDVVSNQCSNRLTPSSVTFTPTRRYAGEGSVQQKMMHIETTFSCLKQLVGCPYNSEERSVLESMVPYKLVQLRDGFTGVCVPQYCGKVLELRPEQVIACLFAEVNKQAKAFCPEIRGYVLTVPPWWRERERRSVLASMKIANMHCMSLINSTTAAAIAYEREVRAKLASDAYSYVLFIDAGNSAMNVALTKLKPRLVEAVDCRSTPLISGSHFNRLLTQHIMGVIESRYKIKRESLRPRTVQRLEDAIEKAKRELAVNGTVQFECASLAPGVDVQFPLKREDFSKLISPCIDQGMAIIEQMLADAKVRKERLYSVQILGGCSRVFLLKQTLENSFGKLVSSNMNKDECFAIGSGLFAASLLNGSNPKTVVKDVLMHDISVQCGNGSPHVVFPKGTQVPVVKRESIQLKSPTDKLYALCCGEIIGECTLEGSTKSEVKFSLNHSMLFRVDAVPPAKAVFLPVLEVPQAEISEMMALEQEMDKADGQALRIEGLKNDIEMLVFELKNAIEKDCTESFTHADVDTALHLFDELRGWLEENEEPNYTVERCESIQKTLQDILARGKASNTVKDRASELVARAETMISRCEVSRNQIAKKAIPQLRRAIEDVQKHLNPEQAAGAQEAFDRVAQYLASTDDWLNKHRI